MYKKIKDKVKVDGYDYFRQTRYGSLSKGVFMCFWRVNNKGITVKELAELCDTPEKLSAWLRYNIKYVTDKEKHDVKEYWQTEEETLDSRSGDCEDSAILAKAVLGVLGYTVALIAVSEWEGWHRNEARAHMVCAFIEKGTKTYYHIGNWKMKECGTTLCDVADKVYPEAKMWQHYLEDKTTVEEWVKASGVWRRTKPKE